MGLKTIDLIDIQKAAYLELNHVNSRLIKGPDGRVVFRFLLDEEVQHFLIEYESNPEIRLLDYVGVLKRLRGRMLDARDGNGNGYKQHSGS